MYSLKELAEEHAVLLWRLAVALILLMWGIAFYAEMVMGVSDNPKDLLTPPVFIGMASLTLLITAQLLVFPSQFYPNALLYLVWGILHFIDGEGLIALFLYLLGCAFAFRAGFFRGFLKAKLLGLILIAAAAIASQCRYDADVFGGNLIHGLGFLVIVALSGLLFYTKIQALAPAKTSVPPVTEKNIAIEVPALLPPQKATVKQLSDTLYTDKDIMILEKILNGEHYNSIAKSSAKSLSGFKKHVRVLFYRLGVPDGKAFIARYAGCVFILEENVQPPAEARSTEQERS
jgi:hypothetical protein